MRIMYTGENLPADRESLFWLNVLILRPNLLLPKV
ncbi:fimbria/pilus periplasmic chaperone [Escherichia coli]